MKKILFVGFVFACTMLFISCGEDDTIILPEEEFFVAFEEERASIDISSDSALAIPVYVAAEKGAEVNVQIGVRNSPDLLEQDRYDGYGFAQENTDYEFDGDLTLSYPEGTGYDTLRIYPKQGGTPGDLIIELVLESNSAGYRSGLPAGEDGEDSRYDSFVVEFIR